MSTTDGRRGRMQRILKLLKKYPAGLEPYEIAAKTEVLTEITQDRLYKYLAELHWAGTLILICDRYALNNGSFMENERERRSKKERVKKP